MRLILLALNGHGTDPVRRPPGLHFVRIQIMILGLIGVFALSGLMPSVGLAQQRVIFDTDMAWDWDDVGAMATLHALANLGEAEILGMGISTRGEAADWNPQILDIINTYYNRPDIPIGMPRHGITANDNYGQWLVEQGYPYELDPTWDAVDLYRKLLSESPDQSVVLISVGYLNNMDDLLNSEPDQYSPLSGHDLIVQKVKFWSAMAGGHPGTYSEANMQDWSGGYAEHAVVSFPVPILFTSQQVGDVETGTSLLSTPLTNPVRAIYEYRQAQIHPNTIKHPSFDQIAVLVAIRDVNDLFLPTVSGNNLVWQDGGNRTWNLWEPAPNNGHRYFIHQNSPATIAEVDLLMAMPPTDPSPSAVPSVGLTEGALLDQNVPNPFNPLTEISFSLANPGFVELGIYDLNGARVTTLLREDRPAGSHVVTWDGTHSSGRPVSSGVYLYRLKSGLHIDVKRMTVIK